MRVGFLTQLTHSLTFQHNGTVTVTYLKASVWKDDIAQDFFLLQL